MQGADLSLVGLFIEAGLVGKAVMAVLFVAALWCWVLIVEGVISVTRDSPRGGRRARGRAARSRMRYPASPSRSPRPLTASLRRFEAP